MSGVRIIGTLLTASGELIAIVPETQMGAGALPVDTPLPWIVAKKVSGVDYQALDGGANDPITHRVQVSVRAADYETKDQILGMLKGICANQRPNVDGFAEISVLSAGEGPDFDDVVKGHWQGSRDFMVTFTSLA